MISMEKGVFGGTIEIWAPPRPGHNRKGCLDHCSEKSTFSGLLFDINNLIIIRLIILLQRYQW